MSPHNRVLLSLFLAFGLVFSGCRSGDSETPTAVIPLARAADETPAPQPTKTHAAEATPIATEGATPTAEPTGTPAPAAQEAAVEEAGEIANEETPGPGQTDEHTGSPQHPVAESPIEAKSSPMGIESLRARDYESEIAIEEILEPGSNYQRFIASYMSDGYRIYGLLTVPDKQETEEAFAAITFLHGYLPPDTYATTARYVAYQDRLASSGYITLKPDLRGHGESEGVASGAFFSEAYTVDTLNAISALESYEYADPDRIGLWGHSNGGATGLRVMAVTEKARAGVFWAGVVGSWPDMLETYISEISFLQRLSPPVIEVHGSPSENPDYWIPIDPFSYLESIAGPIQLHHGTADHSVPAVLSISLRDALLENGKVVEYYEYAGADHNISGVSYVQAMDRTVAFFDKYLE